MVLGEILTGALFCFWLIYGSIRSFLQNKSDSEKKPQVYLWAICGCICTVLLVLAVIIQSTLMTLLFYIILIICTILVVLVECILRKRNSSK